jgi:hypothetical protein
MVSNSTASTATQAFFTDSSAGQQIVLANFRAGWRFLSHQPKRGLLFFNIQN